MGVKMTGATPLNQKKPSLKIFTDGIFQNGSVTGQIRAIGRNLPFLTSPGIFGRPATLITILRIDFRGYCEIFSLLGAIRVQKMTSKRQRVSRKSDIFVNYLPPLALLGVGP